MNIREHITALNEKRLNINKQQQTYIDEAIARHPNTPFNAEERRRISRMDEEIEAIAAEVRQYNDREERLNDDALRRETHGQVFGTERALGEHREQELDELRGFISGETGRKWVDVDIRRAAREHQLLRQGVDPKEVRSLLWDTGSIGSTVPTMMASTLYEYAEAAMSVYRMPTTKVVTDGGWNMDFPRVTAHAIGTQVAGQGTAIGGTDPTFGKTTIGAFKYGDFIQISNESLTDSGFDAFNFLFQNMGRALGRVVGTDLVTGNGSTQPNGVMNAALSCGSATTGGTLITPTYEKLVDTAYTLVDEYRSRASTAWLMKDSTAGVLRKLRADAGGTTGMPLWQASVTAGIIGGQPDTLLGWPAYTDPGVAACGSNARIMAIADWNAYYIRTAGAMRIERSDDYAFNTDLVSLRAVWRIDADLLDTNALVTLKQNV